MKERPILMSGVNVVSILEGRKTQTRRIAKPQPESETEPAYRVDSIGREWAVRCPYGQPGDRLWVRESGIWTKEPGSGPVIYAADGRIEGAPLLPSIFMPRWASRILLEVTAVRVERLQDISIADVEREGIPDDRRTGNGPDQVAKYRALWESINGPESWDANPYVWVVEFKRLTADQLREAAKDGE